MNMVNKECQEREDEKHELDIRHDDTDEIMRLRVIMIMEIHRRLV